MFSSPGVKCSFCNNVVRFVSSIFLCFIYSFFSIFCCSNSICFRFLSFFLFLLLLQLVFLFHDINFNVYSKPECTNFFSKYISIKLTFSFSFSSIPAYWTLTC
ncbi:hypothetical protein HanPI659440_Chr04g0153821 [Helianthus annuus]|nr:hypothetical protein HanPI659440_Chr04g0153821 [Helianthus annuus]